MLKGMTGYGRACGETSLGSFAVEITTLNRRHLEIHTSLPPVLQPLVTDLRSWIGERVARGQVRLTMEFEPSATSRPKLYLRRNQVEDLQRIAQEIVEYTGISSERAFSLAWESGEPSPIAAHPPELNTSALRDALRPIFQEALENLLAMKSREGESIQREIVERCSRLRDWIGEVKEFAPEAVEKYRVQLRRQLEELAVEADEEAVTRQLVLFAGRVDIEEELSRFQLHLTALEKTASGKEGDFLLQELLREANTVGSKASDYRISERVVKIKSELERIREQIQNVE